MLNINSLWHNIIDLRHILIHTGVEIVVIGETKLDSEFPDDQFHIDGYSFPHRRDRNQHGGGLLMFTRNDLITRRLENFESSNIEMICIELIISKRKWVIFSVYRPPKTNLDLLFAELNKNVDKATRTFDNIINIDNGEERALGMNKLSEFCDIFSLKNLIRGDTCVTANSSLSIDVILTNRKRSFKNSSTVAFHKMVLTTMRANYERLKPIQIQYRSYKYFREDIFLRDLGMMPFHKCRGITNKCAAYDLLKQMFLTVVDRHAPLKKKLIRGTQAPFMNKELSKAIMHRSKLRNIYNKTKTTQAWEAFKRQRNKRVSIRRKNI